MDESRPTQDDLPWMALFMVTGHRGRFINPDTGRRRWGMGSRPTEDLKIHVLSLTPPFDMIEDMDLADYWSQCELPTADDDYRRLYAQGAWPMVPPGDEEEMAYAHWALRAIDRLTRYDEARFYCSSKPSRNDVLSISFHPNIRHLRIWSDTRATDDGQFMRKGDYLPIADRPRFYTDYSHPFAESIHHWFDDVPGVCSGSIDR